MWVVNGDFGAVTFVIQFVNAGSAVDISTYTTLTIRMGPSGGTINDFTASFTTDGTDGQIEYTLASSDIDTEGVWLIQGKVEKTGAQISSRKGTFEVHDAI